MKSLFAVVGIIGISAISIPIASQYLSQEKPPPENQQQVSRAVLAASAIAPSLQGNIVFNIPAIFNEDVTLNKGLKTTALTVEGNTTVIGNLTVKGKTIDVGGGEVLASNVLYKVTGGTGISISSGQSPTITNTGVTSFQGSTGSITLSQGSGISISGTTITNTDAGSAQNIFKNFTVGSSTITAGTNADTLTFVAGTGVTLSADTTNKQVTINSTGGLSGLTAYGVLYATGGTSATTLAPGSAGYVLQSNGTGVAPSWVPSSASQFWQLNSGVLSPLNTPNDFAVGGTATASAKFLVSATTGNITASGTLTGLTGLTSSGTIDFTGLGSGVVHSTSGVLGVSAVNLASEVTGTLPLANGGTGANLSSGGSSGSLVYYNGSTLAYTGAGTGSQCLLGGTTPSWGSCGAVGTNWLTVSNGELYPINSTLDLVIGGTGTSSAKFQVAAASGNITATGTLTGLTGLTSSGTIDFTGLGSGVVQSTAGTLGVAAVNLGTQVTSTLPVGNGGTGATSFTSNGILYGNGTSAIQVTAQGGAGTVLHGNNGTPSFSAVSLTADVSGILPLANGGTGANLSSGGSTGSLTYYNGSTLAYTGAGTSSQCLFGGTTPTWGSCATGTNWWNVNASELAPINSTLDLVVGGTGTSSAKFQVSAATGNITATGTLTGLTGVTSSGTISFTGLGTGVVHATSGTLGISNVNLASEVTGILPLANGGTGANLSSGGSTGSLIYYNGSTFAYTAAGTGSQCLLGGTTPTWGNCATGTNWFTVSNGELYPINSTLDFVVGGTGTSSAKFQVAASSGNITATGTLTGLTGLTSSGTISFTGLGTGVVQATSGTLGIAAVNLGTQVTSTLPVGNGGTGATTFTTNGILYGNGTSAIQVTAQGASGTVLHGNGASAPSFSAVSLTSDVSGILPLANGGTGANLSSGGSNGSLVYYNGSTLAYSAAGTGSQCLLGGTTPTWGSCALGTNWFTSSNGALYPINSTLDFLVGGNSSTSANFAFLNNASGTPTASISGNLTLNSAGVIATTNMKQLTLGSSSTGPIQLSPKGTTGLFVDGSGNVGINTTNPGNNLYVYAASGTDAGITVYNAGTGASDTAAVKLQNGSYYSTLYNTTAASSIPSTTGFYTSAPNGFLVYPSAKQAFRVKSNIAYFFGDGDSGTVGIGTNTVVSSHTLSIGAGNAQTIVDINGNGGNSYNGLTFLNAGTEKWFIGRDGTDSTDDLIFRNNASANVMRILTGASANVLTINGANVGINNTSPVAKLDLQGAVVGKALAIFNETGDQALFTASSSGTPQFTIKHDGTVVASKYNTQAGILYLADTAGTVAETAQGNSGQCLISNGTGAPSWATCATGSAGTNWWNVASGALYPINSTLDFLVGGNSSSSANFAFLNNASGTPTASVSGNLTLNSAGVIATTNMQPLTIGSSTTGPIQLSPKGTTGLFVNGSGNVGVGTTSPNALLAIGGSFSGNTNLATKFVVNANSTIGTSANTYDYDGSEFQYLGSNNIRLQLVGYRRGAGSSWQGTSYRLQYAVDNSFTDGSESFVEIGGDDPNSSGGGFISLGTGGSDRLSVTSSGNVGINTTNPSGTFEVKTTGTGNHDPLAKFDSTGASDGNSIYLANGTGTFSFFVAGASSQFMPGTTAGDGGIRVNGSQSLFFGTSSTTYAILNASGNLGVGTTNPSTFKIQSAGSVGPNANNTYDLGSASLQWNNIYGNTIYSNGQALSQLFQRNAGTLSPLNITDDLILGGTATSSAKFQIFANSGNATTSGNLTFNTNGLIATTNMQPLTIGGATTGPIQLSPNGTTGLFVNGSGNVGIGTTTATNTLQVAGVIGIQNSQTITGVANYTQFNNGISVGGATTYGITSGGVANLFSGSNVTNNGASYFQVGSTAGSGSYVRLYADVAAVGDFALTDGNANSYLYETVTGGTLIPSGSTGIGKNITSPHAVLDVEGGNTGGNAAFIVNQNGATSNDILDASASGTLKFAVGNDGTLTDAKYNTQGGLLYINSSTGTIAETGTGTSAQCLLGGTTPSFGSCGGTTNWFTQSSGAIFPINSTLDFLLGGTATTSAKVAFTNMATGNPTLTLGIAGSSNGYINLNSSGAGKTAPSIYADSTGGLNLTAPSGIVTVGNGSGDITLDPGGSNLVANLSGNGSFLIEAAGATFVTFDKNSATTFAFPGTTTTAVTLTGSSLTTGQDLSLTGGPAMTTGNLLSFSGTTYVHTAAEMGKVINLAFTDNSTLNAAGTTQTIGLNVAPIFGATGSSGTHELYGAYFQTPTVNTPTGTNNIYGIRIGNQGASGITNAYGLYIDSQSSATNNYAAVFSGGNVGVGTISPTATLTATGSALFGGNFAGTASATIQNTGANNVGCGAGSQCHSGLNIQLGTIGSNTVAAGSDHFINFMTGSGITQGSIQGSGTGVALVAGTGDYAERFTKENPSESLPVGTMVCETTDGKVTACNSTNVQNPIGVVSGTAIVIGNSSGDTTNTVIVGLLGQLSVFVSSQNGSVQPGDPLTASSIPGVAMKATKAGPIIGHALGSFSSLDPSIVGSISVLMNASWFDPSVANNGLLTASESASVVNNLTDAPLLTADTATISGTLNVLGRTTLNDLGITGTLSDGLISIHGLQGEIDTLAGDLMIQSEGLGGVNFLNGLVTIDTTGNVNIQGVLSAQTVSAEQVTVKGNKSTGSAIIPAGQTTITITADAALPTSRIFLTPTTITTKQLIVTQKGTGQFTVTLSSQETKNVSFDWLIIGNQ